MLDKLDLPSRQSGLRYSQLVKASMVKPSTPLTPSKSSCFEISYSSTLLFFWVLLLAYIAWSSGYIFQAASILLLSSIALTSKHGESRLLMPLVFLSESCLRHTMNIQHSFLEFYASTLLSYLSLAVSSTIFKHELFWRRSMILRMGMFTLVGVAAVCSIIVDKMLSVGVVAYVVMGHVFFLLLSPKLGENEAVLVSSIVGFYVCDTCINNNLSRDAGRIVMSDHNAAGYLTSYTHVAGRGMILGAIYTILLMQFCSKFWRVPVSKNSKSSEWGVDRKSITIVFWTSCAFIGLLLFGSISYQFQVNFFVWLYVYIVSSSFRSFMLVAWLTGIPVALLLVAFFTSGLRKTVRRKMFHFIAVVAFTPPSLIDPPFLAFAISTAISLLVLIEVARCGKVYGTDIITRFISDYIDERDDIKGIVRTHIYLLFGLSVSQILNYRYLHPETARTTATIIDLSINVIPGITSLGIVDASAAIIGSSVMRGSRRVLGRYLKNKFFTERANISITHKTTTGTLGGLLCGVLFWCVILAIEEVPLSGPVWYTFFMILVCTLVECFINTIDNLQMPLVVLGAVYSMFTVLLPVPHLWTNPLVNQSNPTIASALAGGLALPWKNEYRLGQE